MCIVYYYICKKELNNCIFLFMYLIIVRIEINYDYLRERGNGNWVEIEGDILLCIFLLFKILNICIIYLKINKFNC